jgi:type IV pilus assembly protein PilY1
MNRVAHHCKRLLAYALSASLAFQGPLYAALTDIADGPLAQPASTVKPNLLMILDDSGSMARQFTPDYIASNANAGTVANCMDSRDGDDSVTTTPQDCFAGDPPMMSPDFNTQYYNPEIRYFPAVDYDGTSRGDMTCARTNAAADSDSPCVNGWTVVPTDNVSTASADDARKNLHSGSLSSSTASGTNWDTGGGGTLSTMNLATGFPDRVWCKNTGDSATDTANCRINSSYTYPSPTPDADGKFWAYGRDGSSNRKYRFGAPYYYRILPTEHCTNASLTTCVASSTPTTVSGVSYSVPAKVRFCDTTAHTNCQAKRTSTFKFPKFLGTINPGGPATPGVKAAGKIVILTASDANAPVISQISVTPPGLAAVNLLSATVTTVATNTASGRSSARTTIVNAINANTTSGLNHGYVASNGTHDTSSSGSTEIILTAPVTGVARNGSTIAVTSAAGANTPASLSFSISGTGSGDSASQVSIGPGGAPVDLMGGTAITCSSSAGCTSTYGRNKWMAEQIAAEIESNKTAGLKHGYSAVTNGSTGITITAPAGTGAERNGYAMTFTESGLSDVTGVTLSGGVTSGDLEHSTVNFSGGTDDVPAVTPFRQNVGNFVRTDIVPANNAYPKSVARTDCLGVSSCTYAEEMTNFANWFTYYRTRIQMAKSALGRAFLVLGSSFRVGYMTINFSTTHYLAVGDFTTAQKQNWYTELYDTIASGGTPNRAALARAGQYYGGKRGGGTGSISSDMGASPIQLSCQPNYAILATDGYWTTSGGSPTKLDGTTTVGNQDSGTGNPPAEVPPYATKSSGSWDGNGASNSLADTAMYYYTTDLRTDLSDLVPASGLDTAPHQHMTTFTVGLGLAGQLTYDPNYLEQTSGDFFDIKQGTKYWPTPVASEESTLDDLWHAAVNGRGRFFSAQDPAALANGISETLNSVQARIGAGAAAATSNLQPVAGDNFAFTAQYQTVEWSGDLRARTIDLSTGTVATRELWSAQALLDQRAYTTRRIYTYDAADDGSAPPVVVDGVLRTQNANKLRSFCPKDAPLASNSTCDDGGLLTTSEMNTYFDPDGGANGPLDQANTWASDGSGRAASATAANLVDFLRGDATNEMTSTSATTSTDLYRNRAHILGDIVNAQPAYVRTPSFAYSDAFYGDFKTAQASRKGRVYVAANDGMLHAFHTDPDGVPYFQTAGISTTATSDDAFTGTLNTSATNGEGAEDWAYVPSLVFPKVKRLAEIYYSANHSYTVDGTPVVGDVCFGATSSSPCSSASNWRTILVAGLNNGGTGYYALDITDPANPKGLWELKGGSGTACIANDGDVDGTQTEDCNIGKTFGNPVIAKLPSTFTSSAHRGKWVVFLASGHNNVPAGTGGDGLGHFYIVDAQTGKILMRKTTPAGDTTTPSGLARINAWVDNASTDNTAQTIYGGDTLGNLWRFQLAEVTNAAPADNITSGSLALLATVKDPSNVAQPITVRPELGEVNSQRVIYFGTGAFLGTSDKTTFQRQTVYAIKDEMTSLPASTSTAIVDMTRTGSGFTSTISGFKRQTLSVGSDPTIRTVSSPSTVNFTTDKGWFIDLPDGGSGSTDPSERVNVDPILQLGTLVIPTNVPSTDTCTAGGYGYVNFFDYRTGSYIPGATSNMASAKVTASLLVGINVVQLPGGTIKTIVTTADNQQITKDTPVAPTTVQGRRVSWRELFVE